MLSNSVNKETGAGQASSLNAANDSLQSNLGKESLYKKEQVDRSSMHDRFDLLGDVSTLLRDVKQNNQCHVVKQMVEDLASSAYSQNLKQCDVQSPDELVQTLSNVFNRNHRPFLKKITTDLNSLMSDHNKQSDSFGMPCHYRKVS